MPSVVSDRFSRALGDLRGTGPVDFDDYLATLGPVDLSPWRGRFVNGWTNSVDDNASLRAIGDRLGYRLVVLWDEAEPSAFERTTYYSGHSDIYVLDTEGCLREPPLELHSVYMKEPASFDCMVDASQAGEAIVHTPGEFQLLEDHHAVYVHGNE